MLTGNLDKADYEILGHVTERPSEVRGIVIHTSGVEGRGDGGHLTSCRGERGRNARDFKRRILKKRVEKVRGGRGEKCLEKKGER